MTVASARLRRAAFKAQGLCVECGDPAVTRNHCRPCADRANRSATEGVRRWRAANPNRMRAHNAIRTAVKNGTLVRPSTCSSCGKADRKITADHHDYTKPLEVTWLCYVCHRRVTEERRAAGVAP